MHNSVSINLNVLEEQHKWNEISEMNKTKILYSGSACMYPEHNQLDPDNPDCREESAYPADPDSEYGWEKLFSERLYLAYNRNYDIPVRIARYHNIFGPEGTWDGGREKVSKQSAVKSLTFRSRWSNRWGRCFQTRSFLHIDECIEANSEPMDSDFMGPKTLDLKKWLLSINWLILLLVLPIRKFRRFILMVLLCSWTQF